MHIWSGINVVPSIASVMLCFRMLGYRMTPYLPGISALLGIVCGSWTGSQHAVLRAGFKSPGIFHSQIVKSAEDG